MTESDKIGRMDLRPLAPDAAQTDRVVAAVMARVRATEQLPPDTLIDLAQRLMRPALISAAVLAAAAACTIVLIEPRERSQEQPAATLVSWIETQHVPTNGELLLAFQGYGR